MAWMQIIDSDGNGATPQPYTDTQGHSTTMTVTSSNGQASTGYGTSGALQDNWVVGDNSPTAAEFHTHTFSEPVHVLRIDIHYLNNGDAANFGYTDVNGTSHSIDIQAWIDSGDAVVNLAPDHSIQTGLPGNPSISVIRGTTPNNGTEGGTTTIEFYFPAPVTDFGVGKNHTGTANSDAYGYELYYDDITSVTCFTSGTLIDARHGQVAIEGMKSGDIVRTMDNGFQPIRWIGATRVSGTTLVRNPKLLPVRIKAGALDHGVPERDLVVSRQHRVLLRSKVAQRLFGVMEILVPAIKFVSHPGIEIAEDVESVTYWHILFDRHEVIFAEGAPTESLFTGPEALKSVSSEARQEIRTIFPQLVEPDFASEPARTIMEKGARIRQLVARHIKNDHPLV